MHLLSLFHFRRFIHLSRKKRSSPGKRPSRLHMPIAWRLVLGFFLAALLAATATGIVGSQHAMLLSQQSSFYQTLLRLNTVLTDGTSLLKSIDAQTTILLNDASIANSEQSILSSDEQELRSLLARYNSVLLGYASHDLLSQHPEQVALLDYNPTLLIEQQRTYIAGSLQTWQIYADIQDRLLQEVTIGEFGLAQELTRLQGEPAFADSLGALHSLFQFNDRLAVAIDNGATNETGQQIMAAILGAIFTFLGVMLVGILLSRTLLLPLKQLHQVTQKVERGVINARVEVLGTDEIADVSRSVNAMLDSLVEALEQSSAAKEQVNRAYQQQRRINEMKDHFIQNVSHELRTPLTEIYGFLQLLREHQGRLDAAKQALFLDQALSGCEDLLALFATILDAAEIRTVVKAPHLEILSLKAVVERLLEHSDPRERAQHPVYLEVPDSLNVWADLHYLRQVLRNLLSNAFKYTPPQTPIVISADERGSEGDKETEHSQVWICVKDAGPGITKEEQSMLFQQFVRLKRTLSGTIRGTGLGLYLCRQFIEAMDGHIWVESSGIAGEGSSFWLTLPSALPRSSDLEERDLLSFNFSVGALLPQSADNG